MNDKISSMLARYEAGTMSRRDLVASLAALAFGNGMLPSLRHVPAGFHGRTLNHVTVNVKDLARSKAFYQHLFGLRVIDEDATSCRLSLENGFLALDTYEGQATRRKGLDHFCVGIDGFRFESTLAQVRREFPEADASVENDTQVYLRDPDGAKLQLCAVNYKG